MKKLGVHLLLPLPFGISHFVDYVLNSTKGSPVQPTVNTHTSAQHVSNSILNSNVGEAKTTNMATKPLHPNLVYLKQLKRNPPPQTLLTPIKYDRLAFYLLGYDQNKA